MSRNIQTDLLKDKILQIEKNIEEENGRRKINRIPARYFMFFFIIGEEAESGDILKRKVKELLRNPDACEFMQISEKKEAGAYGKQADEILRNASENRVDVSNLNTVFLCPVIFSDNSIGDGLIPVLREIDAYMTQSGHMSIWQPTLIIDRNIDQYKNIYSSVNSLKSFASEMPEGKVNRCCLLSNKDENGFKVPKENIMQTVAMTVVLQNVDTEGEGSTQRIRSMVTRASNSSEKDKLFFTARNTAVTNPSRSLVLQRMCSAMGYFSEEKATADVMPPINYSFVTQIVRPYLDKLPMCGGRITLFPLFGVMSSGNLQDTLRNIIDEKYYKPIYGEKPWEEQVIAARNKFLECYFAQNGSLSSLKELIHRETIVQEFIKHQAECYADFMAPEGPNINNSKLSDFRGMHYQAAKSCSEFIKGSGWNLLETVGKRLCSKEMENSIEDVENCVEQIASSIRTRIRQLRDVETVLVVDQTMQNTDFDDVQSDWFKNEVLNNFKKYGSINKEFNECVYDMLCTGEPNVEKLLEVCYSAVKDSAYSNNEYMDRVSDECAKSDVTTTEFIAAVEKSWCYTLRFINFDSTGDATCIIGDSNNYFCRSLKEKFNGSLFEFALFDRIDVLHISGAFDPENVLEWEQIKAVAEA